MSDDRTLRVVCPTWDHVEVFYSKKLRRGGALTMRVPFSPVVGEKLVLALELPNEMVIALDSEINDARELADSLFLARLTLLGLTVDVIGRLEALVADGRGERPIAIAGGSREAMGFPRMCIDEPQKAQPVPHVGDVAPSDKELFVELDKTLRTFRTASVFEVLGLSPGAEGSALHDAYLDRVRQFHPDKFSRNRSKALRHMASELLAMVNRAYDRARSADISAHDTASRGVALFPHTGWLVGGGEDKGPATPAADRDVQAVVGSGESETESATQSETASATESETESVSNPRTDVTEDGLFGDMDLEERGAGDAESDGGEDVLDALGSARAATSSETSRLLVEDALLAMEEGDYVTAQSQLVHAKELEGSTKPLLALARVVRAHRELSNGNLRTAHEELEAALKEDPDCLAARKILDAIKGRPEKRGLLRRLFE